MDTLHKDLWLTLDHKLRVKTIQKIPDCELRCHGVELTHRHHTSRMGQRE